MSDKSYTLEQLKELASNLPFEIKRNIQLLKNNLKENESINISFLKLLELFNLDISNIINKEDFIEVYKFIYDRLFHENIQIIPMLIPDTINLETEIMLIHYIDITADPSVSQAKELSFKKKINKRDLRILKEAKDKMAFYNTLVDVLKNIAYILPERGINLFQQEYLNSLLSENTLPNNSIKLFKTWINFILKNGAYKPYYRDLNALESKLSNKDLVISILAKIYIKNNVKIPLVCNNFITKTIASMYNIKPEKEENSSYKNKSRIDFFSYASLYKNEIFLYKKDNTYAQNMSFNKDIHSFDLSYDLISFLDKNIEKEKDKTIFDPSLVKVANDISIKYLTTITEDAPFYIYTKDESKIFIEIINGYSNKSLLGNIFVSNMYINLLNKIQKKEYLLDKIYKQKFMFTPSTYTKTLYELIDISTLVNDVEYKLKNVDILNEYIPYISSLLTKSIPYYISLVYSIAKKRNFKLLEDKDLLFYLLLFLFIHMFFEKDTFLKKSFNYTRRKEQILTSFYFAIKNTKQFYKSFKPYLEEMLLQFSLIDTKDNYLTCLRERCDNSNFVFDKKQFNLFIKLQKEIPLFLYYLEYELENNITYLSPNTINKLNDLFHNILDNSSVQEKEMTIKKSILLTMFYSDGVDEIKYALNIMDYLYNQDDSIHLQDIYLKCTEKDIQRVILNERSLFESNYLSAPLTTELLIEYSNKNNIFSILHFDKRDIVLNYEHYKNISILSFILYLIPISCTQELLEQDLVHNLIKTVSNDKNLEIHLYTPYVKSNINFLLRKPNISPINNFFKCLNRHINQFVSMCSPNFISNEEYYFTYLRCLIQNLDSFNSYILQSYLDDKLNIKNLLSYYLNMKEFSRLLLHYFNYIQLDPSLYNTELKEVSNMMHQDAYNMNLTTIDKFENFIIKNVKVIKKSEIYSYACKIVMQEQISTQHNNKYSIDEYEEIQVSINKMFNDKHNNAKNTKKDIDKNEQKNNNIKVEEKKPLILDFSLISQKQKETSEIQDVIGIIKDENENMVDNIFLANLDENNSLTHSEEAKYNGLEPQVQNLLDFIISKKSETIDLNEFKTLALENKFLSHYAPIEMINDYFYELKEDMLLDLDEENSIIYVTLDLLDDA